MKETPYQPIDIVPFDPHHATAAQWAAPQRKGPPKTLH